MTGRKDAHRCRAAKPGRVHEAFKVGLAQGERQRNTLTHRQRAHPPHRVVAKVVCDGSHAPSIARMA